MAQLAMAAAIPLVQCIAFSSKMFPLPRKTSNGGDPSQINTLARACSSLTGSLSFSETSLPVLHRLRRPAVLLPAKIKPKLRLLTGSLDANRNLGSRAIFLEEAVGRLEQRSHPSAHHL